MPLNGTLHKNKNLGGKIMKKSSRFLGIVKRDVQGKPILLVHLIGLSTSLTLLSEEKRWSIFPRLFRGSNSLGIRQTYHCSVGLSGTLTELVSQRFHLCERFRSLMVEDVFVSINNRQVMNALTPSFQAGSSDTFVEQKS